MISTNCDKDTENASPSRFIRLVQNHYTASPPKKDSKQLLRESWLVPGLIPFSRCFCMPAAFIIQFCIGSLYSWSVFNKPIDNLIFGSVANMAPITFYIAVGFLGLSAAVMGPWLERNGPRTASILGGSLFCAGTLITAVALYWRQIGLVYVGYGIIAGCGIGICYISPVSALQKYFPDKLGLASGIAVSGFGAGSIVSAKLEVFLIHAVGLPLTFVIMGGGSFMLIFLSGLVLRTPPPGFLPGQPVTEMTEIVSSNPPSSLPSPTVTQQMTSFSKYSAKDELSLLDALCSTDFRLI